MNSKAILTILSTILLLNLPYVAKVHAESRRRSPYMVDFQEPLFCDPLLSTHGPRKSVTDAELIAPLFRFVQEQGDYGGAITKDMIVFDHVDFKDIEKLYEQLKVRGDLQPQAGLLLEELTRRSLVLKGDERELMRLMLKIDRLSLSADPESMPDVIWPNLFEMNRAELAALSKSISNGYRITYMGTDAHPLVRTLLARIEKYGEIEIQRRLTTPK